MKAAARTEHGSLLEKPDPKDNKRAEAFAELERAVHTALETYSKFRGGAATTRC
jgi:hypothetical protein